MIALASIVPPFVLELLEFAFLLQRQNCEINIVSEIKKKQSKLRIAAVCLLPLGAKRRRNAVANAVEICANFHCVARLSRVLILIGGRLEKKRVATFVRSHAPINSERQNYLF